MPRALTTVLLLVASNIFMTYAWYYHLKKPGWGLAFAILASWGLAFFEYVLQVPANRYGHSSHGGPFSAAQLKIMQEAITLTVFGGFCVVVLKEKLRTTDVVAFALIMAAAAVSAWGRQAKQGAALP
ncbi:MAG: DMT family protein [Phycisphaerales bacterium]|nr:DMT family protein [Phycisphaerales bacterium]